MWNAFVCLLKKDIRCLVRSGSVLCATFGFALLLVIVASFSFRQVGYGESELRHITPGILWTIFLFSGVICLNYSFLQEQENGSLRGVLLTGVDTMVVFFAKFLANVIFFVSLQIFSIVSLGFFLGVDLSGCLGSIVGLSILAAIGFIALGTLLSAISVTTTGREILLPLLLFPLLLPVVAAAVFLTREVLVLGSIDFGGFWFSLLCIFAVISFTLSSVLFGYVVRT